MCILFFYLNPNPEEGKYQLILASNRDEFYTRPTQPAAFWESDKDCISGNHYFKFLIHENSKLNFYFTGVPLSIQNIVNIFAK